MVNGDKKKETTYLHYLEQAGLRRLRPLRSQSTRSGPL